MLKARNAYMVSPVRRRIATNAGHTVIFYPNEEKLVPGIIVGECRRHGVQVVREVGDEVEVPVSTKREKVPELVQSTATLIEDVDPADFDESVYENVTSTSDADEEESNEKTVQMMDKFSRKEARIKDAIMALISEGDEDKFVASTGLPKLSAISTRLGGEGVNSQVRDLVWKKMQSHGIID